MYYVRTANKYGAKKTEFNGRVYDSEHEAGIAGELELLKRSGDVIKIAPQKTYNIYGKNGNRICTHRPDVTVIFKDTHQEIWGGKTFCDRNLTAEIEAV